MIPRGVFVAAAAAVAAAAVAADWVPPVDAPDAAVARTDGGPRLVYSDDPETVPRPGILYRDRFASETARFYLYHCNGTAGDAALFLLARPAGASPASVTLVRSHGTVGDANAAIGLCRNVERDRLRRAAGFDGDSDPPPRIDLDPCHGWIEIPAMPCGTALPPGHLCHVVCDLAFAGAPVEVAVVFGDAPLDALAAGVLPGDGHRRRGTFPASERRVDLAWEPAAGPVRVAVGSVGADPALVGVNAVTGEAATLRGNYGLTYRVRVGVSADSDLPGRLVLVPRGGPYGGAVRIGDAGGDRVARFPADAHAAAAGTILDLGEIIPRSGHDPVSVEIETSPTGGCALPFDLWFVPGRSR